MRSELERTTSSAAAKRSANSVANDEPICVGTPGSFVTPDRPQDVPELIAFLHRPPVSAETPRFDRHDLVADDEVASRDIAARGEDRMIQSHAHLAVAGTDLDQVSILVRRDRHDIRPNEAPIVVERPQSVTDLDVARRFAPSTALTCSLDGMHMECTGMSRTMTISSWSASNVTVR